MPVGPELEDMLEAKPVPRLPPSPPPAPAAAVAATGSATAVAAGIRANSQVDESAGVLDAQQSGVSGPAVTYESQFPAVSPSIDATSTALSRASPAAAQVAVSVTAGSRAAHPASTPPPRSASPTPRPRGLLSTQVGATHTLATPAHNTRSASLPPPPVARVAPPPPPRADSHSPRPPQAIAYVAGIADEADSVESCSGHVTPYLYAASRAGPASAPAVSLVQSPATLAHVSGHAANTLDGVLVVASSAAAGQLPIARPAPTPAHTPTTSDADQPHGPAPSTTTTTTITAAAHAGETSPDQAARIAATLRAAIGGAAGPASSPQTSVPASTSISSGGRAGGPSAVRAGPSLHTGPLFSVRETEGDAFLAAEVGPAGSAAVTHAHAASTDSMHVIGSGNMTLPGPGQQHDDQQPRPHTRDTRRSMADAGLASLQAAVGLTDFSRAQSGPQQQQQQQHGTASLPQQPALLDPVAAQSSSIRLIPAVPGSGSTGHGGLRDSVGGGSGSGSGGGVHVQGQPLHTGPSTGGPAMPFFARAMCSYVAEGEDGMSFEAHQILRIMEPRGDTHWLAENLSSGDKGVIPNEGTLLAAQDDWPPRETKAVSLISRLLASKVHSASQSSLSSSATASAARIYQPVQMRKADATMLRPVVILGPGKDLVIDRLVLDYPEVFHTCVPHTTRPKRAEEVAGLDYFFVSGEDMEADISKGLFAETVRYQGHLYGTSFGSIVAASQLGGYCVLDVTDPKTIATLERARLFPIAIFLRPASVDSIIYQNAQYTRETAAAVFELTRALEASYRSYFCAIIDNDSFEQAYYKTYLAILAEARKPVWAVQYDAPRAALPLDAQSTTDGGSEGTATTATGTAAAAGRDRTLTGGNATGAGGFSLYPMHGGGGPDSEGGSTGGNGGENGGSVGGGGGGGGSHTMNGSGGGKGLLRRRSSRKSFVGTETIRFEKGPLGLGFSFAGGVDAPTAPGDTHVYVTKIAAGGSADQDGRLQVGDKIIEANNESLAAVSHVQAGEILRSGDIVKLKIIRKCRRVRLVPVSGVYGLGIKGGADAGSPVVISRISEGTPAALHPRLELGHEITHVNGQPVRDLSHSQVLALIKASADALELIVHPRRGRASTRRQSSTGHVGGPGSSEMDLGRQHSASNSPAPPAFPGARTHVCVCVCVCGGGGGGGGGGVCVCV
jgi:guanylate kinase